jgi:hypothetical protein
MLLAGSVVAMFRQRGEKRLREEKEDGNRWLATYKKGYTGVTQNVAETKGTLANHPHGIQAFKQCCQENTRRTNS